MTLSLNEQARDIHRRNYKWWHDKDGNRLERNRGELLMLVVSEIAEAMEALRTDAWDDKLPHRKGEEVELADAYIRLLDFAEGFGLTVDDGHYGICSDNKSENLLNIVESIVDAWSSSGRRDEPVHLSDAIGLVVSYCDHYNLDLQGAVAEKLTYNDTRRDHTYEAREAHGGKKF